jgi:hypothetical protein
MLHKLLIYVNLAKYLKANDIDTSLDNLEVFSQGKEIFTGF